MRRSNGRNFEHVGEDPLLAGGLRIGNLLAGVQSHSVIGDVKHDALNDQETDRQSVNVLHNRRAMRETDLLAFEIAIETGHPPLMMCAYNRVEGEFACENEYLLNQVLKHDCHLKGFVLSDSTTTPSTVKARCRGKPELF